MFVLHVLNVAILNRSDIFVKSLDYFPPSHRKAAYSQFVLWQEGHLGRGIVRLYHHVLYGQSEFTMVTLALMDYT